jgi:hypothetical protein
MENMVMMGDIKIPKEAISRQIAESVDLIVQVKRLRDGSRRVTNITEVIGMEGPVIVTQEMFKFEYLSTKIADGKIHGEYRSHGLRPYTLDKARQFGFDQPLLEACRLSRLRSRGLQEQEDVLAPITLSRVAEPVLPQVIDEERFPEVEGHARRTGRGGAHSRAQGDDQGRSPARHCFPARISARTDQQDHDLFWRRALCARRV